MYRLSYSLLAVLLLLTVGVSFAFYKNSAEKDAVNFQSTSTRLQTEIENKVNLYVTLLTGLRGFIRTSPDLNRSEFASYVDNLRLKQNYPALLRVGYIRTVPGDGVARYREELAKAGYGTISLPAFEAKPEYQLISFVEPQSDASLKVIGHDAASDPDRRAVMESAARSGAATMSGRLRPVIDPNEEERVIAIYLPVYSDDGSPQLPAGARNLVGFVYTSFTPAEFVKDIERVQVNKDVAVQIYDGAEGDDNLIAGTQPIQPNLVGLLSDKQTLRLEQTFAGRPWVTRFTSLPQFSEHSATGWTPILFIAGTCFSFLVFGFTYHDASRRAELQKLTGELLQTQKEKEKLFEQEQHARLDAEDANRAKDEFLAIVSHELKTPLNTIAGWTTILRSDQLPRATKETALKKIEKNLRLQAKMVEQILNFSQIMSDNVPTDFSEVRASDVFARAIEPIEKEAAEKTIALRSVNELDAETIDADPEKLSLALGNVLTNAVKFTLPGGLIEARAFAQNGDVRFTIKDNGAGIDPDFLPHVFEHYRQGDKPAVRAYGGLGLGLAITKHIVERHGGAVMSASEGAGCGAEFTVSIPLHKPGLHDMR